MSEEQLAVPHVVRHYYMQQALATGFSKLAPAAVPRAAQPLQIIGYGPSLLTTWRQISSDLPIMTLSGAHDFVLSRQLFPDYHADCDPRAHKAEFIRYPSMGTYYLMASCCHPCAWGYLQHRSCSIWHKVNGPETEQWLEENGERRPDRVLISGCSIGIASLALARALGYQRVRLFGFDSSYSEDGDLRAGFSDAAIQPIQSFECGGITYATTENMKRQALEFESAAEGLEYELIGDGLLRAIIERSKHHHEAQAS